MPLVLINRKIAGNSFRGDFIDTDNIEGAGMMTEYLIRQGHTRIGVINGNTSVSTGRCLLYTSWVWARARWTRA